MWLPIDRSGDQEKPQARFIALVRLRRCYVRLPALLVIVECYSGGSLVEYPTGGKEQFYFSELEGGGETAHT